MEKTSRSSYAVVIIKLFKGVIYSDDSHWDRLQTHLTPIREYFDKIGLEVRNFETDGFAYLTQPEADPEDDSEPLPRFTERRPLSYPLTMLCVLLREELRQFDASDATGQCVIDIDKIRDLLQPYLSENNNEDKFRRNVSSLVNKAKELKFLRQLSGQENKYEIKPILKAKIDAETLSNLKQKLEEYAATSPTARTD